MQYISKEKDGQATMENQQREERLKIEKEKKAWKKYKVLAFIGVSVVLIIALTVYARSLPGRYDSFAKCLTEKGAVMYGEDWCQYTNAQKNMFGKSFKYINYKVKQNLDRRPTWVINGKSYETVQSFERLAALTGCEL